MKNLASFSYALSKNNLVLTLKTVTIVGVTLAIFWQDLSVVMTDALQIDSMSHILVIPFLFTYLLYRKRKMVKALIPIEKPDQPRIVRLLPIIAGVLLSTTAILLYWYGSYTFTPLEYHMSVLPIFVVGLVLIFFNTHTLRQLAFPISFLMFLIPPPLEALYALGSTLSVISSKASYSIVNSLGIPSTITSEFGTPTIQITSSNGVTISFAVDIACSGIYSLIGFLIFAAFATYIIRGKPWKKAVLFLTGFSLIYALNIMRITTILLIGYYYGEEAALQLFHLLGGWVLIFIGTFLLLIFAEKILRSQIFTRSARTCVTCNPRPERNHIFCLICGRVLKIAFVKFRKTDIVKIAAVIVCTALLVSVQTPVFALTEGPAQVIIQTPVGEQGNTQLLPYVQGYTLEYVYRDKNFEETSGQDASLIYAYIPTNNSKESVWVTVEIGSAAAMLHRWEVCLITWQLRFEKPALVTQLDLRDTEILHNPPIIARYFAFQWTETNQKQVVLYWYENSIFKTNNTAQQKRVKISLVTYPNTGENLTKMEELLPFAAAIAQYWVPIKTWSQIALLLSQQSIYIAAATATLLLVITILYVLERRKQTKSNAKAYQKLSTTARQVIDMVTKTEKTTKPTLHAIAVTYKNTIGNSIEEERLMQKLSEVEKTGIIRSKIASVQDEPTQVWKTDLRFLS